MITICTRLLELPVWDLELPDWISFAFYLPHLSHAITNYVYGMLFICCYLLCSLIVDPSFLENSLYLYFPNKCEFP